MFLQAIATAIQHHAARIRCVDGEELPEQENAKGLVGVELQLSGN